MDLCLKSPTEIELDIDRLFPPYLLAQKQVIPRQWMYVLVCLL